MWRVGAPVHGQCDGEPDGSRVAYGRQVLGEAVIQEAPDTGPGADLQEAPGVRHVVDGVLERVEVEEARQRPQTGQQVRLTRGIPV